MIDLPDELILLLLEKIDDGTSLLRCRKACRLLYRISFDRLLLLANFNTISNGGELLLVEEVINNRELFTTVVEDGRWKQMIDNLVKRQFRIAEALMPDNGVQSLLTVIVIDNASWSAARDAALDAAWDAARSAAQDAAWDAARDAFWDTNWYASWYAAWYASRDAARSVAWNAARDAARDVSWDAWVAQKESVKVIDTIKNIITGESNSTTMGERAWCVAEYLYLTMDISHDDIWQKIYHLFDGMEPPEKIQPFWDDPALQGNAHAMEYKRLFSTGKKENDLRQLL
jgi:hypothetical protein